jgi:Histidine kinase-, DNA gyrase B-, and HSP90-like ATPase
MWFQNGFHAATKRKAETDGGDYEPTLTASTKNLGDRVEIRIRDNGTGIAPDVKEKMFNPFFTTKPTGEGTGLGLSISHDIIVKQHAGAIEVDTQPGEFNEIRVILPRTAMFVWMLKRAASLHGWMSAIGPKRTSLVAVHMSAFGGKADMTFRGSAVAIGSKADMAYCSANVRLWPKADINTISQGAMDGAASVPIENALFHRHAGERESGGNVRRRQWACLYFNQGCLPRDWSKPGEALLEEFNFRRCHLFVRFLLLFGALTVGRVVIAVREKWNRDRSALRVEGWSRCLSWRAGRSKRRQIAVSPGLEGSTKRSLR